MSAHYDAIVVGMGGIGSATLCHLAGRGARVLGLEQFVVGHSHGSSHGETRVIRKAYFEHPDYVPLLHRAYENWRGLESQSGKRLLVERGLLEVGPHEGPLLSGLRKACAVHRCSLEDIDRRQFTQRFPRFNLPERCEAVFEPDAGYLLVEQCVQTYCEQAVLHGADLLEETKVYGWQAKSHGFCVHTSAGEFECDKLIVTAGSWAKDLLADLGIKLRILRKHLHWYDAPVHLQEPDCPIFFYETPNGYYYGFPAIDAQGEDSTFKIAEHSGGECIPGPEARTHDLDLEEQARVEEFLRNYLGVEKLRHRRHEVCMYTCTDDENFVVDFHPDSADLIFAAGLSGHGFKFASVLGEILGDLALDAGTELPVEFLKLERLRN